MTNEPNSLITDNSFVILGEGSMSDLNNEYISSINSPSASFIQHDGASLVKTPIGDSRLSYVDATGSLHNDNNNSEMQAKWDQLVKENMLLKETLSQNNLAMKSQFDTLLLWHEEVVMTHESHKKKFQETQEHISKLKLENAKLKQLIEQEAKSSSMNGDGQLSAVEEGLSVSNDVLQRKLESAEDKLEYLVSKNEELRLKNEQLVKSLKSVTDEKDGIEKSLKLKIDELNQQKANEQKMFISMEKSVPVEDSSIDPEMSIIKGESDNVSQLKEEISDLKQKLSDLKENYELSSVMVDKIKVQRECIQKDNEALQNEVEVLKDANKRLMDENSNNNAQLKIKDELLEKKSQEMEQLQKEMKKLELNLEEVAFLKAQLEVYQTDFNEERQAREQAVGEKEKMMERIRYLERTLKDMSKEETTGESKTQQVSETTPQKFKCPNCLNTFTDLNECERHVNYCLDASLFP